MKEPTPRLPLPAVYIHNTYVCGAINHYLPRETLREGFRHPFMRNEKKLNITMRVPIPMATVSHAAI